jgi:Holliday junction resolvase RusA-like endonuclease
VSTWLFSVDGTPKGQPRPRAFARKVGGRYVARVFEAGTAEEWKSRVVVAARPYRPQTPIGGPVAVQIEFHIPRPKSRCRKRDPEGFIPCVSRPDIDNLAKAVLDALQQDGWWRDDAQVMYLEVTKHYHPKSGAAGAKLMIQEVDP